MQSVGFAVTYSSGLVALVNVPLGSFKFFIAGLVSLFCDVIFVSCRYCVYLLAATRSLSQWGVFLLFFAFVMTSGEVHIGDIAFSIVDNDCIVVVFIAAVLCVHVACLLVFFQCALYEVCCRLPSFRCCRRGSRSDDFTVGSAGNNRSSVSPGDVLSWWLPCALLPCLCSSFAGDGVYSVSLFLSDVPRVRGVLADVVLYSWLGWLLPRSRALFPSYLVWPGAFPGHVIVPLGGAFLLW